jgi:hypothetical protein
VNAIHARSQLRYSPTLLSTLQVTDAITAPHDESTPPKISV